MLELIYSYQFPAHLAFPSPESLLILLVNLFIIADKYVVERLCEAVAYQFKRDIRKLKFAKFGDVVRHCATSLRKL